MWQQKGTRVRTIESVTRNPFYNPETAEASDICALTSITGIVYRSFIAILGPRMI